MRFGALSLSVCLGCYVVLSGEPMLARGRNLLLDSDEVYCGLKCRLVNLNSEEHERGKYCEWIYKVPYYVGDPVSGEPLLRWRAYNERNVRKDIQCTHMFHGYKDGFPEDVEGQSPYPTTSPTQFGV